MIFYSSRKFVREAKSRTGKPIVDLGVGVEADKRWALKVL